MTKAALKKKIYEAIDQIDDLRVLKMILAVAEDHLVEFELTADEKKKLDIALDEVKNGKSKLHTWEEVKEKLLSRKHKKKA